jgi:hypothetical protein
MNILGLIWIWRDAALRRRDPAAYAAIGLLLTEGAALVVGRGDCPFGPFQARLGDPVPMFEWVLPPRAAKAAIPVLTGVALASLAALLMRPPARGVSCRDGGTRPVRSARLRVHAEQGRPG